MKRLTALRLAAISLLGGCALAATPAAVADPVAPPRQQSFADAASPSMPTEGDIRFMERMIAHHAQALEMTSLVPGRAARDEVRLLALRMELTQQDEIDRMRRWLAGHGRGEPQPHAHPRQPAVDPSPDMPGMLAPADLAALAAAAGPDFDRLFLELMIRHHEGALAMVEELFAGGDGQGPEVFALASHIDSSQRAEIARMRGLLQTP